MSGDFQHDFIFLRSTALDGSSYNGFQWPTGPDAVGAIVEAPDWDPKPECGNGLHGLPEGFGNWGLLNFPSDPTALWYVCGAKRAEVVSIDDDKIKVPRCRVLYVGHFAGAMDLISPVMTSACRARADQRIKAAGERAASNSGYGGAASNSGDSGAASNSGYRGAASSAGKHGVALEASGTGRGMVTGGNLLVLVERDETCGAILHHFAAMCGKRGVKPGRWYSLRGGKLVEVVA